MPTTCFPYAGGVPRMSGAPNWYDDSGTLSRIFNADTDDPRWEGAMSHSLNGDGTIEGISFRGLSYTESGVKKLFLSWVIRIDPTGPNDSALFLGLGTRTADPGLIVRIGISTADVTTADIGYGTDVYIKPAGDEDFSHVASDATDPSWIGDYTRMWVNYLPSTTPELEWAVQMVVPLGQELSPEPGSHSVILPDDADFKMWYSMYLGLTPEGDIIEAVWPGTPGIGDNFPPITEFVDVRAAYSADDSACTAEGISLDRLNIGTRNVDGTAHASTSKIQVDLTNDPPTADDPDEQNMFFAIPDFPADMPEAEKIAVRANFRLANWGSTIGDLTSESWMTIPGGDAVEFTAADGECNFTWPTPADVETPGTLTRALIDDMRTGVRTTHQCMLVELSSAYSGGAVFINKSVYRNMDFESASSFTRSAEIALRFPGVSSDALRDVFLYEKTFNMPAYIPRQAPKLIAAMGSSFTAAPSVQLNTMSIARSSPTYTVQAYHDTGRTTSLFDGTERRILKAQTSFGYFVQHEGPLYGWNYSIVGADRKSDHWYKLRVPENGARTIQTTIEADETPGCREFLLILVGLIRRLLNLS